MIFARTKTETYTIDFTRKGVFYLYHNDIVIKHTLHLKDLINWFEHHCKQTNQTIIEGNYLV